MIARLLCEFPAGLACLSLHVQDRLKPPISRPGVKTGYARSICECLGLTGASAYWWAEADPDVAALIAAYASPEALLAIAGIIRGWKDEEPRALWTRLRDERKKRIAAGASLSTVEATAEYAQIVASNRLISVSGPELRNTGKGGTTFGGGEFAIPAATTAGKFEEIAKSILLDRWSFSQSGWRRGYGGPGATAHDSTVGNWTADQWDACISIDATARRVDSLRTIWPPVRVSLAIPSAEGVASAIGTPGDLEGVVVYMDPPYVGTSGYLHDLPRPEVIRIARDFDRLGAVVCVSEAEVIEIGWASTEIYKTGNARTFSKQKREFLTINRAVKAAHSVSPLFASAWAGA